jgi:malate dehydrogenase
MEGAEIAVIGASGDIGRAIVTEVLHERVLTPAGRIQLVGRADGPGMGRLLGLVSDLSDAFAEVAPDLEVIVEPERVTADVVVMAAGVTLTAPAQQSRQQRDFDAASRFDHPQRRRHNVVAIEHRWA